MYKYAINIIATEYAKVNTIIYEKVAIKTHNSELRGQPYAMNE